MYICHDNGDFTIIVDGTSSYIWLFELGRGRMRALKGAFGTVAML